MAWFSSSRQVDAVASNGIQEGLQEWGQEDVYLLRLPRHPH